MSDTATDPVSEVEAAAAVVLDALADLAAAVAELRAEVDALRSDVRPALEAVAQLGPMAEKMASGGILGMLRS